MQSEVFYKENTWVSFFLMFGHSGFDLIINWHCLIQVLQFHFENILPYFRITKHLFSLHPFMTHWFLDGHFNQYIFPALGWQVYIKEDCLPYAHTLLCKIINILTSCIKSIKCVLTPAVNMEVFRRGNALTKHGHPHWVLVTLVKDHEGFTCIGHSDRNSTISVTFRCYSNFSADISEITGYHVRGMM